MARRRTPHPAPPVSPRQTRADWLIVVVALLLAFVAFVNTLDGDFVFDDLSQIVSNGLIQSPSRIGAALTSDVWAFRSADGEVASNYWRPTFVTWLIANYAIFGVEVTGWHFANILLHAGVVVLTYWLLRALRAGRWLAAAITFIFSVHPVHTETVAWISGSPDLLMTLPFLGAWLLVWSDRDAPAPWKRPLSWALMAAAIFAKESAVLLPLVIFVALVITDTSGRKGPAAARAAALMVAPFFAVSVIYFLLRLLVIGQFSQALPWQWGPVEYLLTFPSILLFYIRQSLFPLWIGPSYPLRPVTLAALSVDTFWLPLLLVVLAVAALVWMARRGALQRIGAALFFIPLLPTFHINAFLFERIVHDRFLYLPLLGMLMMVVPTLAELFAVAPEWNRSRRGWLLAGALAIYALLLLGQTVRYNRAWTSELDLWSWAIQSDPNSAFNWGEYGRVIYQSGGDLEAAKRAIERSLGIATSTPAMLIRADIATREERLDDAFSDLQTVLARHPDNVGAILRLSVLYQRAGRVQEAVDLLEDARQRYPAHYCTFTTNLAVGNYLLGQKEVTLRELEAIRPQTVGNSHPDCRRALFHLGQLYEELGRATEARILYLEFLALTAGFTDASMLEYRAIAAGKVGG